MEYKKKTVNLNDKIQELALSVQNNTSTKERDFNELCVLLMPKLEYYVWRFFKDEHTIKDIVSETFEKMIRKIDTFNPKFRFTTWIYRIATNVALGHINKQNAQNEVEFTGNVIGEMSPNDSLEFYESDFDRLHKLTIQAIFDMPDDINKSIIIEKHINDLKGSEIADKFGMNENTVKTKLRAMRKKIRDYIKNEDEYLYKKSNTLLHNEVKESFYELKKID